MARAPKKPLSERIIEAEMLGSRWLANGNEAAERGDSVRAERCYDKAQFWLDRYNLLAGLSDRPPPKQ
jgi:hypothetical protein